MPASPGASLDGLDEIYAADFIATTHNPPRWRLAFDLLDQQMVETCNLPGRSRTSDAAKLLLAALDPAMIYANRSWRSATLTRC